METFLIKRNQMFEKTNTQKNTSNYTKTEKKKIEKLKLSFNVFN